ncbi:MAG: nucleotidyltransferase domain-containing protein [Pyrinomonadaceae bacterium]|nr:nucleotidyltransferase domain-containing protein [Pyrinomonadaceae bacterium]
MCRKIFFVNELDAINNLLVPVGTQIVTLIDAKILNENRFQKRGAVCVVITQPRDAQHSYIAEFPDNSKSSLKRNEFAIRKHFQNDGAANAMRDLNLSEFVIYRCVVGSRAFGLDDENSDTDLRGIYLPPADFHWSLNGVPEQIENKANEECYWELQKFLTLALKANPNILECLHTPLIEFSNDLADELISIRYIFYSQLVYQTYNGYVMSQFKKLEGDLRNNQTIRPKHAMHLIRLLLQGIGILRENQLNIRVAEHRDKLLAVKRGEIEWNEINAWRLSLHKDFDAAFANTELPERPDYKRANEFLIKARRLMV